MLKFQYSTLGQRRSLTSIYLIHSSLGKMILNTKYISRWNLYGKPFTINKLNTKKLISSFTLKLQDLTVNKITPFIRHSVDYYNPAFGQLIEHLVCTFNFNSCLQLYRVFVQWVSYQTYDFLNGTPCFSYRFWVLDAIWRQVS